MNNSGKHQNQLVEESSPYLLQHANNPVNWHPWGPEAFSKAQQQDKPIFLSSGYATCHWCHVMAHESFEDEEIAAMMNRAFINIKVDREERPDIDKTYMLVCQMLSGSGGWPLNVLLTPQKKPFYAATYIPKEGRHGRPGMHELIPWISQLWTNEREKVQKSTDQIIQAFQKSNSFTSGDQLDSESLNTAYQQFEQQFDEQYGGFGSAPKFPTPHNLIFLLRYYHQYGEEKALRMAEQSLTQMRRGGIYDHIGLGFHRYSTDRKWLLPHFEKMLYDQAMLLMAYTEGWQCTNNQLFKQTVDDIIQYLSRKMQHPEGGFYSAEDADSDGEEGKFYIWTTDEIRDTLSPAQAALAIEVFNVTEKGNYKDEATGRQTGKSILHLQQSINELAEERNMDSSQLRKELASIRRQLLEKRQERTTPLLDDKILTDWNGLVIAALAKAGRVLDNDQYIEQAKRCYKFIFNYMVKDETLYHRYRNNEVGINAHADDYAFLIWGLIELYEATFSTEYLEQAVELNQQFIDHFWDDEQGGFFFTAESGEELLGRKKEIYDGALPSSNSVAMLNLLRLGRITGRTNWEKMADQLHKLFASDIQQSLTGFGAALQGIAFATGKPQEIIIAGNREDQSTQQMLQSISSHYLPHTICILNHPHSDLLHQLIPFLGDFKMKEDTATAYVCQNYSCQQPTTKLSEVERLLQET